MLAIFGIDNPITVAIAFAIVGGIFAALKQFTKHREAKYFKDNIDDLQKRIEELPKDATEQQFKQVMDDWKTAKK